LEDICRLYWDPLYAFIRRSGFGREDAEDLVQEFLSRVIERGLLDDVSAEKGKLRSWLLALLKPFLNDRRKHDRRLKRGGGAKIVSIDSEDADRRYGEQPVENMTAEDLFERRWAVSVLAEALVSLGNEYAQRGRAELFNEIRPHLQWQGDGDRAYAQSAEHLGMTEGAVKVAVHRLRRRYREVLRREVAETLGPGEDVDAEIRHLFTLFAQP
jgi:RNA polymerase sigma-70 factor (ECF subfamily)